MSYIYIYDTQYNFSGAKDSHNLLTAHVLRITFGQRTWHWTCLVFTMLTLKKTTARVYFLQYDICMENVMHYIILFIAPEHFRIVMHSCGACFPKKRIFMKFTAFFISRAKQVNTKP